ncbi:MAG: hypothetical protein V4736_01305 [Bdellovibrionota bacterium]
MKSLLAFTLLTSVLFSFNCIAAGEGDTGEAACVKQFPNDAAKRRDCIREVHNPNFAEEKAERTSEKRETNCNKAQDDLKNRREALRTEKKTVDDEALKTQQGIVEEQQTHDETLAGIDKGLSNLAFSCEAGKIKAGNERSDQEVANAQAESSLNDSLREARAKKLSLEKALNRIRSESQEKLAQYTDSAINRACRAVVRKYANEEYKVPKKPRSGGALSGVKAGTAKVKDLQKMMDGCVDEYALKKIQLINKFADDSEEANAQIAQLDEKISEMEQLKDRQLANLANKLKVMDANQSLQGAKCIADQKLLLDKYATTQKNHAAQVKVLSETLERLNKQSQTLAAQIENKSGLGISNAGSGNAALIFGLIQAYAQNKGGTAVPDEDIATANRSITNYCGPQPPARDTRRSLEDDSGPRTGT